MKVAFRENERGRKFPFVDIGSETHGRISFRLWVNKRFIQPHIVNNHAIYDEKTERWYNIKNFQDGFEIVFPIHDARIEKTSKGSLVLRPCKGSTVYNIMVPCGHRGGAGIDVLSPPVSDDDVFRYQEYRSARGNLGIDEGALVNCPTNVPLKYRWRRTGRLYGAPAEGVTIIMPDGTEKELDMLPDGLEAIEELPVMGEAEQSA